MKKNGFTLIELLAVIVILVIVLLIAFPIVSKIINDSEYESDKRSIERYAEALRNAIVKSQINNPTFTIKNIEQGEAGVIYVSDENGEYPLEIDYEGDSVVCNNIQIFEDGNVYLEKCEVNGNKVEYAYDSRFIEKYSLTVKYVYVDGTEAAPEVKQGVLVNSNYSISSPNIEDYEPDMVEVTGVMPNEPKEIIVVYSRIEYTVTNKFTNVISNNSNTIVNSGESYVANITSTTGYDLKALKVTMNGDDITSTAYNNGVINVGNVKGNIVITASAATSQFEEDSWAEIIDNVKKGNIDAYNVGDTKEAELEKFGTHVIRIANKLTPDECGTSGFSQTACGFVLETDIIDEEESMYSRITYNGKWSTTSIRSYVNGTIYQSFPAEIKNGIISTYVVSNTSSNSSGDTVVDMVYLLSGVEVYGGESLSTRQLDYYESIGVTQGNCSGARKYYNGKFSSWWLRTSHPDKYFNCVTINGRHDTAQSTQYRGVSVAFRIGNET